MDSHKGQIDVLTGPPGAVRPTRVFGRTYVTLVAAAAFAAFLMSGGHVLFDGTAASRSDLTLTIRQDAQDPAAARAVSISAIVRNDTRAPRTVPDIVMTFAPLADGDRLVYRLARGETLAAGKSLAFTVRMPKKPGYSETPDLRFATGNGV